LGAISFRSVSKRFGLVQRRPRAVLDLLRPGGLAGSADFWALRDVSFDIASGETFGLIGSNGSGKSTVLKLISAIMRPTAGQVLVEGSVSALIELGAGFHPDFSGRDNVFLYGSILGLSRSRLRDAFDAIVDFAELSQFIDSPIKHYSSGMQMRLAFAIAAHVEPSILLVDEVLAVGDVAFQQKCLARVAELHRAGVTVVYVSHALETVRHLCDRVAWLDHGRLRQIGDPSDVLGAYMDVYGRPTSSVGVP
jgi:lipopolysaccharide transport system ATP-binding protein